MLRYERGILRFICVVREVPGVQEVLVVHPWFWEPSEHLSNF
jgi:hypothetical protein